MTLQVITMGTLRHIQLGYNTIYIMPPDQCINEYDDSQTDSQTGQMISWKYLHGYIVVQVEVLS